MLGGAWDGTRLSKPYREAVGEEEILAEMSVLIKRYASERLDGERFGDFLQGLNQY
jgi:sulfite reductase (NADPH) hemoprotein beta-component